MFRFWASPICLTSSPVCPHRLSRAILEHSFSRLAGAQLAYFITCLATHHFLFSFLQIIALQSVHLFYSQSHRVSTCLIMFRFRAPSICLFSNPLCPHRLSRATHPQFLIAWPAHKLLISQLTLSPTILFPVCVDNCLSVSSLVSLAQFVMLICLFWYLLTS